MEEVSIECTGQNIPDKGNYVVVIGEKVYNEKTSTWESCYGLVESKIKKRIESKDLTMIKKELQDKGYVKIRDKQYAIGTIMK